MANRKQPFGYKMEQGQIVAHLREAEVVRMIFAQYNSGASMGALAQMLNKQDIPYEDGKLWNKNMAARILADKRYLGAGGYPVIMDDDSFQKAREKREKKQCPVQKTAAQKVLRRLSGQAVSAQVERRVMEMLNHLIGKPEQISCPVNAPNRTGGEVDIAITLEAALEEEMDKQSVNEDTAKSLIFQIAAAKYAAIESEKYEAHRLRHLFTECCMMQELDADLVQSVIQKIHTDRRKLTIEQMNIRKEHDYSALFAGINQAIRADFSQMELYYELGRLICARPEKGAAVAAAAYLAEKYPDQTGFSARNVRRMRDFYRMYENAPELLEQAMRLGWTQNVVILEADLTLEERAWYLQATEQFGWSKLTLQKKIEEGTHLGAMVDIDKEEPVCYTNGEAENQPATPDTFGEIPDESSAGPGAGTTASLGTQ